MAIHILRMETPLTALTALATPHTEILLTVPTAARILASATQFTVPTVLATRSSVIPYTAPTALVVQRLGQLPTATNKRIFGMEHKQLDIDDYFVDVFDDGLERDRWFEESSIDSDNYERGKMCLRMDEVFGDALSSYDGPIHINFNYIFNLDQSDVKQLSQTELETKLKVMFFDRLLHTIILDRSVRELERVFFDELSGMESPTLSGIEALIALRNTRKITEIRKLVKVIVDDWLAREGLTNISSRRYDSIVRILSLSVHNYDTELEVKQIEKEINEIRGDRIFKAYGFPV